MVVFLLEGVGRYLIVYNDYVWYGVRGLGISFGLVFLVCLIWGELNFFGIWFFLVFVLGSKWGYGYDYCVRL